jgi:hypothetical protein
MCRRSRMLSKYVLVVVSSCSITVPIAFAGDPIVELMSAPATKYDFGLLRLNVAIKEWVASNKEQPGTNVLMSRNKQNGIDFNIEPSYPLREAKSKAQAESICRQIGQYFISMILGNAGDPTAKDMSGQNIYLRTWGAYFASMGDTDSKIQEIGKAVSADSHVRVFVGRPDLEECAYVSGNSYKRVPYT